MPRKHSHDNFQSPKCTAGANPAPPHFKLQCNGEQLMQLMQLSVEKQLCPNFAWLHLCIHITISYYIHVAVDIPWISLDVVPMLVLILPVQQVIRSSCWRHPQWWKDHWSVVSTILKNMSSSMGRITSHIWYGNYPLVICYIAIENHHRNSEFPHW